MLQYARHLAIILFAAVSLATAAADPYEETIKAFRQSQQSGRFFDSAYAYAVFPTIGKGGAGVGGAHGSGKVYVADRPVGDVKMTQLSFGLQLGGQAFSQIIFMQDKRAFEDFTGGNFEFGAQATAVAITAGVSAQAGTTGAGAGVSGGRGDAKMAGDYAKGMAVFTVARGGLMYEASIGGQKFKYTPNK